MAAKDLILIIEDDQDIQESLRALLNRSGYNVIQAYSGTEGRYCLSASPDLILLDLMLPGMNGEDLIEEIRSKAIQTPILVMSGKTGLNDRVSVLQLGADDYLTKPFEPQELIARIRAALRRARHYNGEHEQAKSGLLRFGRLVVDPANYSACVDDEPLELTVKEFELLVFFLNEPQRAFTREALYRAVWKTDIVIDPSSVNVHLSHLRSKLKTHLQHDVIQTVYGIGYKLASPPDEDAGSAANEKGC